jgi:hypothetical protein
LPLDHCLPGFGIMIFARIAAGIGHLLYVDVQSPARLPEPPKTDIGGDINRLGYLTKKGNPPLGCLNPRTNPRSGAKSARGEFRKS